MDFRCNLPDSRSLILTALIIVAAPAARAQITVPAIPSVFSEKSQAKLRPDHERLTRAASQLERALGVHNARCRAVSEGSPEAESCTASRERLRSEKAGLDGKIDQFEKLMASTRAAELRDLDMEEKALSQQIKDGLDRMRVLASDAKEESSERLLALHAQLRKLIDKRLGVVKRVTAVTSVRG